MQPKQPPAKAHTQSKAHSQGTQSQRTRLTLQKSLAFLPTHSKQPQSKKGNQVWINHEEGQHITRGLKASLALAIKHKQLISY